MATLVQLHLGALFIFSMILARIAALVLIAPIFGSRAVPIRFRILLALLLTLLVTPLQADAAVPPSDMAAWFGLAGIEVLIGASLGLGLVLLFGSMQLAGRIVAQASGLALSDSSGVDGGTTGPVPSQLLYLMAGLMFVTIGGHRWVVGALLDSFQTLPPAMGNAPPDLLETFTSLLTESFSLGLRAAAPAWMALMATSLVLGLVGRSLPSLNSFTLGFGLHSLIAMAALFLSIGGMMTLFETDVERFVHLWLG